MSTVTLPVIAEDETLGAAMEVIQRAHASAAAVKVGRGYRVLAAEAILRASCDADRVGVLARATGFGLPEGFELLDGSISFQRNRVVLPRFDAPSGYKECEIDRNHTYRLDYDRPTCWREGGNLRTVYAGD